MDVHDIAKNYIRNIYIHTGDWVILIKSEKVLIYAPFQESPYQ